VEEVARATSERESARQDAEYQKYAIAASEFIQINELPALEGSPKQVTWANTLRLKQIAAIGGFLKNLQTDEEELEDFTDNLNWGLSKKNIEEQSTEFVVRAIEELIQSVID
jgi:hypothetical protein